MTHSNLAPRSLGIFLTALLISLSPGQAQTAEDRKQDEAIQRVHEALEHVIETKPFMEPMPLAKFLDALSKHVSSDLKITFRIDKDAFGEGSAEVAATTVKLPPYPKKMHLVTLLKLVMAQASNDLDYRIGPSEFVITTPERALYTATYDIADLLKKPANLELIPKTWSLVRQWFKPRTERSVDMATMIAQAIVANVEVPSDRPANFEEARFQFLNARRFTIRASGAKHAEIAAMLSALRRLTDLSVAVNAHLYEVDDAFYTKLKNAKPVDWEEDEQRILQGKPPLGEPLFKLLAKQQMILAGDEIKGDDGFVANLLSRHHAVSLLPNRAQLMKGEKQRQAILEGVAFVAGMRVTPDRRFVRFQLTEKATEVQQVKKVKVIVDKKGTEADAEIPFLKGTTHQQEFEIPDGGS